MKGEFADPPVSFQRLLGAKGLGPSAVRKFREIIYAYYQDHGRSFPWRSTKNPYHILVSEVMLQQTRTDRVLEKYGQFIEGFPDIQSLAQAPLRRILSVWQGLGYNRRALTLQRVAQRLAGEFNCRVPSSIETLAALPGIGKATAAAVVAFAYNRPAVLVETNIRTVIIHCFFRDRDEVTDAEIRPLVEKTLDRSHPRKWYYALMDYGVMLKKVHGNPGRRSAHHRRQSPFRGSKRQVRGMILKSLLAEPDATVSRLDTTVGVGRDLLAGCLEELAREGLIMRRRGRYSIA